MVKIYIEISLATHDMSSNYAILFKLFFARSKKVSLFVDFPSSTENGST